MSDPNFKVSPKGDFVIVPGRGPVQWEKVDGRLVKRAVINKVLDPDMGDAEDLMRGLNAEFLRGRKSGFGQHLSSSNPGQPYREDDLSVNDDTDMDSELGLNTGYQIDNVGDVDKSELDGFDEEDMWDMSMYEDMIEYPGDSRGRRSDPIVGGSSTFRRRKL